MLQAGIIDPTKVERATLENAASIVSLLLTTPALITDLRTATCLSEEGDPPQTPAVTLRWGPSLRQSAAAEILAGIPKRAHPGIPWVAG